MKAERRHELAENELAKVIKNAPSFWQQSGGKFLLAAIVILLVIVLIQYRMRTSREGLAQATEQLSLARSLIEDMQGQAMMALFAPPQDVALRRKQAMSEANAAIDTAMRLSDERYIEAESMVARGDLNWTAASLPPLPGASTQPTLQMKSPAEYLSIAQESYQTVVNSYPDITHANAAARFSLAAIHEQRGEWDAAKALYEKLAAETNKIGAYQQLAAAKLEMLPILRQPVILGKATTEPALPTLATPGASTQPLPPLIAAPSTTQASVAAALPATTQAAPTTTPATTNATTRP